jgi:hypothetical protein
MLTLFILQVMVQHIPDAHDLTIPRHRRPGVDRSHNGHYDHHQGHQWLMLATILLNLAKIIKFSQS